MLTEEWLKIKAKEEGYDSLSRLIIAKCKKEDTEGLLEALEYYMDEDDSGSVEDWAMDILSSMGHERPYIHDEDEAYQRWKDDQLTEVEQ